MKQAHVYPRIELYGAKNTRAYPQQTLAACDVLRKGATLFFQANQMNDVVLNYPNF